MLQKRKTKAEDLAATFFVKQQSPDKEAAKDEDGIEKYEDAWPKNKATGQHKVTGRKDLEQEEFEENENTATEKGIALLHTFIF